MSKNCVAMAEKVCVVPHLDNALSQLRTEVSRLFDAALAGSDNKHFALDFKSSFKIF
jgi:hypothetical protein